MWCLFNLMRRFSSPTIKDVGLSAAPYVQHRSIYFDELSFGKALERYQWDQIATGFPPLTTFSPTSISIGSS
jgi:hypothetical protein